MRIQAEHALSNDKNSILDVITSSNQLSGYH